MAKRALGDTANVERLEMAKRLSKLRSVFTGNQSEVARNVGVGINTWNRYETGVRDIDVYVLAKFCRLYGFSPEGYGRIAAYVLVGSTGGLPDYILEMLRSEPQDIVPRRRGRATDVTLAMD